MLLILKREGCVRVLHSITEFCSRNGHYVWFRKGDPLGCGMTKKYIESYDQVVLIREDDAPRWIVGAPNETDTSQLMA